MDQEDVSLLTETARRWFADHDSLSDRAARVGEGHHAPHEAWARFADMGWLSLNLDEAQGGFGASRSAAFELLRIAGQDARPEPLDLHTMLAPQVAQALPEVAHRLASGTMRLGMADLPSQGAPLQWSRERLNGVPGAVYGIEHATHLLVPIAGPPGSPLLLVDLTGPGVTVEPARLVDGRAGGLVALDGAPAQPAGLSSRALDLASAGLVADACGAFEAAFELTLDYLKQRVQFGRPLSAQQAVQHRMADIFCDLQQHLALASRLAVEMDVTPEGPWSTLPAAKAFIGRRTLRAVGGLIQLSGGIAVTEDYRLTHLYRRLHVAAQLFGSAEQQLARIDATDALMAA